MRVFLRSCQKASIRLKLAGHGWRQVHPLQHQQGVACLYFAGLLLITDAL